MAAQSAMSGAGTGATIGSAFGPMGSLVGGGIGLLGGGLAGYLSSKRKQSTPIQDQQKQLIDQLMSSLQGEGGPYSDLFNMDEEAFNKSFRDPAMSRFRMQTAPQIQQQYIASGQQRGTGLEDSLARAGVDMDQMLNQQYASMQEAAKNRQLQGIGGILKQGAGPAEQISPFQGALEGGAGYLTSERGGQDIGNIIRAFSQPTADTAQPQAKTPPPVKRAGFLY